MPDPTTPIAPANGTPAPAQTPAQLAEETERKKREAEIKATGAKLKAEKDSLNRQRAEIIAQEKALKAEKDEAARIKKLWERRLTDPNGFMTEAFSEKWRDTLAKDTAGDSTSVEVLALREKLEKEIEARQAEKAATEAKAKEDQTAAERAAAQEEEKAFTEYQQEMAGAWIKAHESEFQTIASTGVGGQIAVNCRDLHKAGGKIVYMKDGKPVEVEYKPGDVPDEMLVAADLELKLDKLLETVHGTPKWKERLAALFKPTPVERKTEPKLPYQYVPRKAITQEMAASGAAKNEQKPVTREERKARLLAKEFDPVTGTFK